MQEVMRINGWVETTCAKNYDFIFVWHTTDDEIIHDALKKANRIVNRYPKAVKVLARKESFEAMMRMAINEDSEKYAFIPRTFIFPQDKDAFNKYQEKHPTFTFIAKP